MKKLDWYIIRRFLSAFVFVVISLVLVILIIDYTEQNDDFVKAGVSGYKIFFDYYLNLIPYFANMLSPITIFIAAVFVTSKMAAHTEVIAMLSAGMSFKRLLVPYGIAAVFVGIIIFFLIGWVVPNSNETRVNFELKYLKDDDLSYDEKNTHLKIDDHTYAYIRDYNNKVNTGHRFALETIKNGKLKSKLKANRVTWNPDKEHWHTDFYSVRKFNNGEEHFELGKKLDTVIKLKPDDFKSNYGRESTMTLPELNQFIKDQKVRGVENLEKYEVERHERMAYPFAIIILTLIGVIVSARKSREGTGFQIALGFLLACIFVIFVVASRTIAASGGMSPFLAAWLPNFTFIVVGFVLYKTVPR